MSSKLIRSTPEAEGVPSASIETFVEKIDNAGIEFHHMTIIRHGKVIAQTSWAPYNIERPIMCHSLTKLFTNTAVGIACNEGLLSLDDHVISFFPDELPAELNDNIKALTVRDLITMRSGHGRGISGNEWRPIQTSWVAEFFKEPFVFAPGTEMRYTSATSYMLSAIVQKVSGVTMHEYLRNRLFVPLGIDGERWDLSPQGINSGGNGLTIKNEDASKIALLYLHGGEYEGKRYLSEAWATEAMNDIPERKGIKSSYGFHIIHEDDLFSSGGYFGQTIVIDPARDMVFSFNAGLLDNAPNAIDERIRAFLKETILKNVAQERLAENPTTLRSLENTLKTRSIPAPKGDVHSQKELRYSGLYKTVENIAGITSIHFQFDAEDCLLTISDSRGMHELRCGLAKWAVSESSMTGNYLHHQYQSDSSPVSAYGAWVTPNVFVMRWVWLEMTFIDTIICLFKENKVFFKRAVNVNTQALEMPEISAKHTTNRDVRERLYLMETQY